jgi:hypothetical protein
MSTVATITITRTKLYPSRPRAGYAWNWLYEATGPDTIKVGDRTLPRKFDNRSLVELRRVLRRVYGRDLRIVEPWKA